MKLLFLAPTLDETNGWGRFAAGFLREATQRLGPENVIAPNPESFRSNERSWKTPFLAVMDRNEIISRGVTCDLIHAANENLAPLAMMLSMALGKPYVVSVHGTYADLKVYRPYVRWLYKHAFARADAVLPVSHYTERIIKRQSPDVRTEVIPGGFTPPASVVRKNEDSTFHILSVGALKPRKGFHTLIAAVQKLGDENIELDIVGEKKLSSYTARLEKMIQDSGTKNVTLHGRIPQEKLDELYSRADLFVLPSEHDGLAFEGLGLVYLEALAYGVPVIGASDSGAEDVIIDGENGFLVKPGDTDALADKIQTFMKDVELQKILSSHAKTSIDEFRWEIVGKKMHDLYMSCLRAE